MFWGLRSWQFIFFGGQLDLKDEVVFAIERNLNDLYSNAILIKPSQNPICLITYTLDVVDITEKYDSDTNFKFYRRLRETKE